MTAASGRGRNAEGDSRATSDAVQQREEDRTDEDSMDALTAETLPMYTYRLFGNQARE